MVDSGSSSCADLGRGGVVVAPVIVSSSSTVSSSYVCDCSVSSCTADSSWSGASYPESETLALASKNCFQNLEPSHTASECFPYCSTMGRMSDVTMRCARLKFWSISALVSRVGGACEALFTLQRQGNGLLQLFQFLGERQIALRRHALARHGAVGIVAACASTGVLMLCAAHDKGTRQDWHGRRWLGTPEVPRTSSFTHHLSSSIHKHIRALLRHPASARGEQATVQGPIERAEPCRWSRELPTVCLRTSFPGPFTPDEDGWLSMMRATGRRKRGSYGHAPPNLRMPG